MAASAPAADNTRHCQTHTREVIRGHCTQCDRCVCWECVTSVCVTGGHKILGTDEAIEEVERCFAILQGKRLQAMNGRLKAIEELAEEMDREAGQLTAAIDEASMLLSIGCYTSQLMIYQ